MQTITLSNISNMEKMQLNSFLGFDLYSMMCVPVFSKSSSSVVALGCAFNKRGGQQYTESDEHVIHHCFTYTSTVLTSTLAFQKQQKLNFECQVRRLLLVC
uniref:GAF domain-containing protein n=2 Tax=Callorhinchus milii TaxID=7868 RepID=A0A4W3GYV3_CALMI